NTASGERRAASGWLVWSAAQLIHALRQRGDRPLVERHVRRAIALHDPHGHWKIESTRSGAGRIEIADAIDDLVVRKMAVTKDDEVGGLFRKRGANRGPRFSGAWKDVGE